MCCLWLRNLDSCWRCRWCDDLPLMGSGSEYLRPCLLRVTRPQSAPVTIESMDRRKYSSASSINESVDSPLSWNSARRSGSDWPPRPGRPRRPSATHKAQPALKCFHRPEVPNALNPYHTKRSESTFFLRLSCFYCLRNLPYQNHILLELSQNRCFAVKI